MKKKGFTLIELLAIIVILAVIALIAVPVVLNIIDKAKVSSYARSSENILESARLYYNESYLDKAMDLSGNKYGEIVNTLSGEKPDDNSQIYIKEDGSIAMILKYGDNCYVKQYDSSTINHVQGDCTIEEKNFSNNIVLGLVTDYYNKTGEKEGFYEEIKDNLEIKPDSADIYISETGEVGLALNYSGTCYKKDFTEKEFSVEETEDCFIPGVEKLKANIVTEGSGLYKDGTNIYRYKGNNPNNYIMLGEEEYRILLIDNQGIKVIRKEPSVKMTFDSKTNARNNSENNTYCKSNSSYQTCNAWTSAVNILQNNVSSETLTNGSAEGTVTVDSSVYTYLHDEYYSSLSSVDDYIVKDATWNIGPAGSRDTLSNYKANERKWKWTGKIGLINPSEYLQARLTKNLNLVNQWLYFGDAPAWTMNLLADNSQMVLAISDLNNENYGVATMVKENIYPVVYLSSNIELTGTGTDTNPYSVVIES